MHEIGDPIPTFELPDTRGAAHAAPLDEAPPATVVVVMCNHCPYVVAWNPRLKAVAEDYGAARRALPRHQRQRRRPLPGRLARPDARVRRLQDWPFPYLYDETQDVARALDALVTPHVFVYDGDQRLVYHGAPDADHQDPGTTPPGCGGDRRGASGAGGGPGGHTASRLQREVEGLRAQSTRGHVGRQACPRHTAARAARASLKWLRKRRRTPSRCNAWASRRPRHARLGEHGVGAAGVRVALLAVDQALALEAVDQAGQTAAAEDHRSARSRMRMPPRAGRPAW